MPARRKPDIDYRYATCRSMGHEWHHGDPIGIDDEHRYPRPFGAGTGMLGLPSHCRMCTMDRLRWLTRSGDVVVRYYPPEGYSRHGDDRLTPQQWRSTYVETLFTQFEQAHTTTRTRARTRKGR